MGAQRRRRWCQLTMHYCHSLVLGIRQLPKGFMFTQDSASGPNERQETLLIGGVLFGHRRHSSPNRFFTRESGTVLPTFIPQSLPLASPSTTHSTFTTLQDANLIYKFLQVILFLKQLLCEGSKCLVHKVFTQSEGETIPMMRIKITIIITTRRKIA